MGVGMYCTLLQYLGDNLLISSITQLFVIRNCPRGYLAISPFKQLINFNKTQCSTPFLPSTPNVYLIVGCYCTSHITKIIELNYILFKKPHFSVTCWLKHLE